MEGLDQTKKETWKLFALGLFFMLLFYLGSVYVVNNLLLFLVGENGTDYQYGGLVLGSVLIIIPYVFAGLYANRSMKRRNIPFSLSISSTFVLAERITIYFIGSYLYNSGGDGDISNVSTIEFIQGDLAPFFSITYILLGVVSVLITIGINYYGGSSKSMQSMSNES